VRRYAGDDAQHVVIVARLDAPRRGRFGGRRARRADPAARPVEVTRATVIDAEPLDAEEAADAWLRDAAGPSADSTVACALAVLNRAVHAQRIAAADPYAVELTRSSTLVTRVGYGSGDDVAHGRWTSARDLPAVAPVVAGEHALRPQERLAALLSARDAALASELLALRARLDLDQERTGEAALQLDAALTAACEELQGWRELPGMAERLAELAAHRPHVAAAAAAARAGRLDEADADAVAAALARLEAALRARTAAASF
jgi:hypothetical protein